MATDPKRVQAAFLEALAVDSTNRAGVLDRACEGDVELRRQVDLLLRAHDDSGDLPPAGGNAAGTSAFEPRGGTSTPRADLQPGSLFAGRYKLRERLGEGGMGIVWVADQIEPVQRRVALKVIKAAGDSGHLLARFEQERQALALMDHPNIAKVLDAGVSDGGQPYFVMELIKGVALTKYCDEAKLTPKERLRLFVPVCQAVQHAHQKGIIHRDLKPSNILVGLYDGRPVPKVIDFGVAKATGPQISEHSIYTEVGAMIGTLEYMSPEQAELNNLDIDTRSDIYALGVVLYEVLTGGVPFSHRELKAAGFAEMLRIIKEVEPPKPSTRLSGSATLPSVAAVRHTEPSKLARLVRGELDWIVMKCLEKDRRRRYETANGLATDIQRYLTDEPVVAGPPSAVYKLRKFVRRNKPQAIAASLLLLALVAGIAGTTFGLIRAEKERRYTEQARKAEQEQRLIAEEKAREALKAADEERQAKEREAAQREIAVEQRTRAEKARDRTRDVLDAMTSSATGDSLSTQKEISEDQKKFLTEVLTYYREFAGEQADDEQTRVRTANAAFRVGEIESRLGHNEQGIVAYQMARDGYRTLAADFPAVPEYRRKMAGSHNNLGMLLNYLGKQAEAEAQFRQALAIQAKLAADFTTPEYRHELASFHNNLGALLKNLGKPAETEEQHRQALAIRETLTADFPAVPEYRQNLAISHNNLGALLNDLGKQAETEAQFRQALAIQAKLAADFPAMPAYRRYLATSHDNLGLTLVDLGKRMEAEEQLQQALAIQAKLAADFPAVPEYRQQLAMSHNDLGTLLVGLGKQEEAAEQYWQALTIREKLASDFPAVPAYQIELGGSYCNFGSLVLVGGRAGESLGWFDKAIATLASIHRAGPRDVTAKQFLRNCHESRALAYAALAKSDEAIKEWDRAIELSSPADQLRCRVSRVTSRLQAGLVAEAVAEVAEFTAPVGDAGGSPKWPAGEWYNFACVYAVASGMIADKKQEYSDRAMELLTKAIVEGFKDAAHMVKDPDLDLLRERADFKNLLAQIQATEPKEPETRP